MTFQDDHALETYKSMISVSGDAIKNLLLINGGAVVAMLAYLGQSSQGPVLAKHAWLPLSLFIAGIFCSLVASWGAYWTQFLLFNESVGGAEGRKPTHMFAVKLSVVIVVLSLASFATGAFSSVYMLAHYGVSSTPIPSAIRSADGKNR